MNQSKINLLMLDGALGVLNRLHDILQPLHYRLTFYRRTRFQFKPRADDIFVVSHPKSGTTWLQAIMYQLTTNGDITFSNISDVCPFFAEWRFDDFEGMKSPRVFKTHNAYRHFPKYPGKFIYIYRSGADVVTSLYYYSKRLGYSGTFDELFDQWLNDKGPYGPWAKHVADWLRNEKRFDILYLKYEDMVANLERNVREIVKFCGLNLRESDMPRILERCSFEFMKRHDAKFDPSRAHQPPQGFMRKGKPNDGKAHLSREQEQRLRAVYDKYLGAYDLIRPDA